MIVRNFQPLPSQLGMVQVPAHFSITIVRSTTNLKDHAHFPRKKRTPPNGGRTLASRNIRSSPLDLLSLCYVGFLKTFCHFLRDTQNQEAVFCFTQHSSPIELQSPRRCIRIFREPKTIAAKDHSGWRMCLAVCPRHRQRLDRTLLPTM